MLFFIAAVDLLILCSEELGVKRRWLEISLYVHFCLERYKNSSGGGGGKPSICLVTGMVILKRHRFVLAVLVGFRDLDHCLVVNDICITLVMTLGWVGWGGGL